MSAPNPRSALANKSPNPSAADVELAAKLFAQINAQTARDAEDAEILMKNCVPIAKRGLDVAFGNNENARKRVRVVGVQKFSSEMVELPIDTPETPAEEVGDFLQGCDSIARRSSGMMSAQTSPNSSFNSDRDVNDSQDTIITLPDEFAPAPLPAPTASHPTTTPSRWTREEIAEKLDLLKLKLRYAMYKVHTNQEDRNIDQVEVRHYYSSGLPTFYKEHSDLAKKQAAMASSSARPVAPKSYSSQTAALLGPFSRNAPSVPSTSAPSTSAPSTSASSTAPLSRKPLPNFAASSHKSYHNYSSRYGSRRQEPEYSDESSSDDEDLPLNHAEYLVQEAAKKARKEKERKEKENKAVDDAALTLPKLSAVPTPVLDSPRTDKYGMDVTSSAVKSANLLTSFRLQQGRAADYEDRYLKGKASK